MKRLGFLFWAASWGYLVVTRSLPSSITDPTWAVVAALSLGAALGRLAELIYVASALWPLFLPSRAPAIVFGAVVAATTLQWAVWVAQAARRWTLARARSKARRDEWSLHPDSDALFTRAGAPLNRAAWYSLSPEGFEEEVLLLFEAHGFTGRLTSLSGDEGIDLDLREKGRTVVAQLKRYRNPVGQPALRDFAGAMRASGADVGYFVTTSEFTDPAIQWADSLGSPRIVLVNGPALVAWACDGVMPR